MVDENRVFVEDIHLKKTLQNRLYEKGIPTRKGLPSVLKANPAGQPSRLSGLQPRNASSSQTRLNTNQNLLTKNRSALISGASRQIQDVIERKQIDKEERLQQSSFRQGHGKSQMMFQSIDDVQLQTHDPFYEEEGEPTTDRATSALDQQPRNQINRLSRQTGGDAAASQVFQSLHAGQNTQSQTVQEEHVPKIGNRLQGTRSMASFTPVNQLLLKVPKAPTDGSIRPGNPVNNWVQNVGEQLSSYKASQQRTFLPQVSQAVVADKQTQKQDIMRNKQFSTLNCEPYHREQKTNFGVSKQKFTLNPSKSMSVFGNPQASVSVTSVTGMKTMTPLGPNSHTYKIRNIKAHQSGAIVGDQQLPYVQSEAFLQGRKETKALRQKIVNHRYSALDQSQQSDTMQDNHRQVNQTQQTPNIKTSFVNKIRKEARESRNPEFIKQSNTITGGASTSNIQPGQLQNTEEILRKHYFMAKATLKTQHQMLNKQESPQKHMIKTRKLEIDEHQGQLNKVRGENIDQLQTQAASLMRLNATWGLESKGPQVDRHKAKVDKQKAESGGVFTDVLEGMQQMPMELQSTMTDLDAMIHFYLQQPEDTGFFIYLIPGESGDPYDLVPLVDYRKENRGKNSEEFLVKYAQNNSTRPKNLHAERFYTMSKKGFTTYVNDEPIEFISLQDWYNDRQYYRQISQKSFFRNFQKWKIIRMWRRNIVQDKREKIRSMLEEKLFSIDEVFGDILTKQRSACKDMENKLRVIDVKQNGIEIQELDQFLRKQEDQRQTVTEVIKEMSIQCRNRFEKGMNKTLDNLRLKEAEPEVENSKTEFKNESIQPKPAVNTNPTLEALGFKANLKYDPRSKLRQACSRFLRFSYLLDFLATEALTNIFILSVDETIQKLQQLSAIPVRNEFVSSKAIFIEPVATTSKDKLKQIEDKQKRDQLQGGTAHQRMIANEYPFFEVQGVFVERAIPENQKYSVYIERYEPPPLGDSEKYDFNPLVHLEIEEINPETEEAVEEYGMNIEEDVHDDSNILKHQATFVNNLCRLWLKAEPDGERFSREINKCLQQGMECLKVFERWSRHPDLDKYEAVLEDWDDRVCEEWEPPDQIYLNCDEWLLDNRLYESHAHDIQKLIRGAFHRVDEFFEVYNEFLTEYWQNKAINFDILKDEQLKNPSEVIEALLHRFNTQNEKYKDLLPTTKDVGMIKVNTLSIREKLLPIPKECLDILKNLLPLTVKMRIQQQQLWLQEQINAISRDPQGVSAYVAQIKCMENIDLNFQQVKDSIQLNSSIFELCVQAELIGREEQGGKREIQAAYQLQAKLSHELSEAREQADKRKDIMKRKITKKVPKLVQETTEFTEEVAKPEYLDETQSIEIMIEQIERNEIECTMLVSKMKSMREYQETLDMKVDHFEAVDNVYQAHQIRKLLWNSLKEWTELVDQWQNVVFEDIDVDDITVLSDEYFIKVTKCESRLPNSSAVIKLSKLVREFKSTMPIVTALGNKKLQDIHWEEIKQTLNMDDENADFILEEKQFTLGQLIGFEVGDKQEEVVHISTTATQEFYLRAELDKIIDTWNNTEFTVVKHKDQTNVFKLKDWDSIITILDESLSCISDIQGSRYVKRLQQEVEKEHNMLIVIADTIEQWKFCQRNWLYLENIFASSKEIKEKCNKEYREFDAVDKAWTRTMKKVYSKKLVKAHCTQQRLDEFISHNRKMEEIQKKVEEYLDEKRTEFPRLYFISNDELLQLLSQNAIEGVEPQLNKLFDQLYRFHKNADVLTPDLIGMISADGEMVEFGKPVKINHQKGVEGWLKEVRDAMVETIKRRIREASSDLNKEATIRQEWVLRHCGQAIAVVSMLNWTELVEAAIIEMEEDPFALGELQKEAIQNMMGLVELIRGTNLLLVERKSLTALITHEVHNRDIIEELTNEGVELLDDFHWKKCLRYYLEEEAVVVRQVNATLKYGYEYMGVTSRLVITPLTDRCWLTITGALHIKLGASPKGPAGTGKTESTKDLAKGLGIFCMVFNCSDQIEYRVMSRIFSGVVQSGVWTCLDEFNRINVEVMSVIAQQLGDIRQAKLMNSDTCFLNDRQMTVNPSCGVFITMNPGYQGRAELPDNLKVLFRAVSMMIPAYGLVAQVMLFSEGFDGAENLATKMVQLYKLSSEQLSQNDHYDFGMRAVKSVLVMAGNLKRANPELPEDVVLIRAMRDSNVPKFVADDLPLFNALIQDLFPGVEIPEQNSSELETQIKQSLVAMNLEVLPSFVTKVTQLFDTFNVRFGVMIVGPAGGGKTTCHKALAHSMNKLRKKKSEDERFQEVKTKTLNPKSISMDELYGVENADDGAWTDGLASKIIRKMAKETSERRHWCVFDGPVDALWIENMNTVLDDNCTLCLANGERVKLRQQMRMLFEVQDLAAASPATVSRCGMVYMTPSELGWRPYKTQWIKKFILQKAKRREHHQSSVEEQKAPEPLFGPAVIQELEDMFELYVDEAFAKLEQYSEHQALQCVPIQLIINLCSILEYFITKHLIILQKSSKEIWMRPLSAFFAFAFFWAFGGHFKASGMRFLDNMMRDFFAKHQIQTLDTVYEYFIDPQQSFKFVHYKTKLMPFEYPVQPTPFFQLVVPTVDTKKVVTLLQMTTMVNKPVFVTGATGTGKSMIVQQFISELRAKNTMPIAPIELNFSAQTESKSTQANIEGKLMRKRKKVWGVQGNAKCLIFIDDVNMPQKEYYGAQPPIELLRQLIDMNGFYDRTTFAWKEIEKWTLVCAAAPPSGGRQPLTPRFMRHFQVVNVPEPTEETLTLIFESILGGFFNAKKASEKLKPSVAVQATIDMYLQICRTMLPIPAKFHYTFNLRDVAKVFQGILMCEPYKIVDDDKYAKLWLHECTRVFADRLCTREDIEEFQAIACDILQIKFKVKWSKPEEAFGPGKEIIFSTILSLESETQHYELIDNKEKLLQCLHEKLGNYNLSSPSKMDLVFFEDAVTHVMSIMRILMQPRGNAMLIGVSGSGKQSLTTLAAFILEQISFQVKLSKNFDPSKFREQLKERMLTAGCEEKPTTFILNDTQIMYESFLEDINNILNTGDITGLYEAADVARMAECMAPILTKKKIPTNRDNIRQGYIESLRDHFHIMLCMSPVGELLRVRSRMFPSLINCCTLNWFDSWPYEALVSVAHQFLKRIPDSELSVQQKEALSEMFPIVHKSVEAAADKFHLELRRKTYVTPKSFLDGINLYLSNLKEVQDSHNLQVKRLTTGINNLKRTTEQIEELQVTLTNLRPKLNEQTESAQKQEDFITQNKIEAQKNEQETEQEAAQVALEAEKMEIIKQEAEAELDKALPHLQKAEQIVNGLSKEDITDLKSTKNPTEHTALALRCVLLYLGYKKPDWPMSQKAMTDIKFLDRLKRYEKDSIPQDILNAVNKLGVNNTEVFNTTRITSSNRAAGGLAKWCQALYRYAEALKLVKPKQQKVDQMTIKYNISMEVVRKKQDEVMAIKTHIAQMEAELQETRDFIGKLCEDKEACEVRLQNAEKLLSLLSDEGQRWEQTVKELENDQEYFKGNVFLAAASLSYVGPFTGNYRKSMIREWQQGCLEKSLAVSPKYSLVNTLGNQIMIRDWQMNDLPSDSVSLDNAILAQKSSRWPLMIDPQTQANKWLKKMLKNRSQEENGYSNFHGSEFIVINATTPDDDGKEEGVGKQKNTSQKKFEYAIQNGQTVLYEEVGETLDPGLDPILQKQIYEQDGVQKINFGGKAEGLFYDQNFRLLITTKLPNPHYLPETCIKLSVINFTVTFPGLEEQLLVDVMKSQEPEIEQQKDDLTIQIATSKNQLYQLQSKILQELADANPDTILDNTVLIENLEVSKSRSQTIKEALAEAEQVEVVINQTRNFYRSVAERGSILYFAITDMAGINQMYQNSLQYVKKLFNEAISSVKKVKSSEDEKVQLKLLQGLIDAITRQLYEKICIGLFEQHKVVYAFTIASSIKRKLGVIDTAIWNFLLRGAGIFDKSELPVKPVCLSTVSQDAWELLYRLSNYGKPEKVAESSAPTSNTGVNFKSANSPKSRDSQRVTSEINSQPANSERREEAEADPNKDKSASAMSGTKPAHQNQFEDIMDLIIENQQEFAMYVADESDYGYFYSMPADLSNKLSNFEKILLIKCLKPEKVLFAVQKYLELELGAEYAISPVSSMETLFRASQANNPIIFVLSQGVDPMQQVRNYADREGMSDRLKIMSLGSNQGAQASRLISTGQVEGDWVFLQNCHLYKSWMQQLEVLVSQLVENHDVHENFRLILTSMPVDYFPQSILQSGLKMTTEPPRGIKANLQRSYQNIITAETYNELLANETISRFSADQSDAGMEPPAEANQTTSNNIASLANQQSSPSPTSSATPNRPTIAQKPSSTLLPPSHIVGGAQFADNRSNATRISDIANIREKQAAWRNLLFGLCFFHAVIQERRKFGPLGWNIVYEFSDSDLIASITMLKNFLIENDEIPWDALKFMTGSINYGGNVTDDFDRILLLNILNIFQNDDIVHLPDYKFSKNGAYYVPVHDKISQIRLHIDKMPNQDAPEIFGMHPNANIAYLRSESQKLLNTVLSVQPREQQGQTGESPEQQILNLIERLQAQVPEQISKDSFAKEIMKINNLGLLHCLSTVLIQEVHRYNNLLAEISVSLTQLHDAILGKINMSAVLDSMHTDLMNNKVPSNWILVSYPSLKPLSSYMTDLTDRMYFMRQWVLHGHPACFWLAGFFFPHGFITGVLQTYARKHSRPIDLLHFEFEVLAAVDATNIDKGPNDGVYIYGLFIENARWNHVDRCLEEPEAGQMYSQIPVIHFIPKYIAPQLQNQEETKGPKLKRQDQNHHEDEKEIYKCPVYKTSARAGVLSTTGQSTNFILTVDLPCGVPDTEHDQRRWAAGIETEESEDNGIIQHMSAEFWTLRGAAMLSMLNF